MPRPHLSQFLWLLKGCEGLEAEDVWDLAWLRQPETQKLLCQHGAGSCFPGVSHVQDGPAGIQGQTWHFRDKALGVTSLHQKKPALMDSGAAADPGPGAPISNHPLSPHTQGRFAFPCSWLCIPIPDKSLTLQQDLMQIRAQLFLPKCKINSTSREKSRFVFMCVLINERQNQSPLCM